MPYEFTEEGMLQRMNAYIEHQNWCQFQKQDAKWPPHSAISFVMGADGQSCKDACWEQGKSRLLDFSDYRIGMMRDQVCFVADCFFIF